MYRDDAGALVLEPAKAQPKAGNRFCGDDVVTMVQHLPAKPAELIAERRPDVEVFRQGVCV
jgi:hypothetical protein